ncbi:DEAD/DEAH box helicase [Aliicoccus persicus]|uniref:ATP-dependent RNA helicase CshB n=1 Tax=Aliicoccus persicus TaxID=930138 RepID=A0A662Z1E1_9STAP|nr:DEAD/DEAH box helicase [Aliicoccus persicus]SEV84911.1 ATP-dependent RNA helicase CshB [Aliicoccus persicus]
MNAFKRFQISDDMLEAIESIGFTHPTLVQERVIPKVGRGEQVIVQSETGSGKSHSFLIPIVDDIDTEQNTTQAIILAPTRELARQLYGMTQVLLEKFPEHKSQLFIGGNDINRDMERAEQQPHIVIGTPNRILSLIQSGSLKVSAAQKIVIDEADIMIDLGFLDTINQIASHLKQGSQFLVFSATIPEQLRVFLRKYIGDIDVIVIETPKNKASIHFSLVQVKDDDKQQKTLELVKTITPYIGIIFANSKERVDELYDFLLSEGVDVGLFHGGLKPRERKNEIKRIRDLEYTWVVASDLAARGLDIDGASHVINYDIPKEEEFFTHRVGRVGRGNYEGVAITLYTNRDENLVDRLEKKGYKFNNEDIIDGALAPVKSRKKRSTRVRKEAELEKQLVHKVRRSKKVKPGYKKKFQEELNQLKREARRKHSKQSKKR